MDRTARLPAPGGMSPEQVALWDGVVGSKPVDWFDTDSSPLLKEYVRAAIMTDWLDV